MRTSLVSAMILCAVFCNAQEPARDKKLSNSLKNLYQRGARTDSVDLILSLRNGASYQTFNKGRIVHIDRNANVVLCRMKRDSITSLIPDREIIFADILRKPKEELTAGAVDLSLNKLNLAHHLYPDITGERIKVSLKEQGFDTNDIDLRGRYFNSGLMAPDQTAHASIMATMLGGAGNTSPFAKGAAPGVYLTSSDFAKLLPDADSIYDDYNITVQNHSYGTAIETYYGGDAASYDASTYFNPSLIHIFSSGNEGASASAEGNYKGIAGYANLTGGFKMAKNIITVGAVDSFNVVMPLSSRGPAFDGRVKPEIVAFGQDGSSGAAALVSGAVVLIQQAHLQLYNHLPTAALTKAVLLNSADVIDAKPLSYVAGYGSLNAANALQAIYEGKFFEDVIRTNQTKNFSIKVPANIAQLKVTLVWSDTPATANPAKALVNDLDAILSFPSTNSSWRPWVLNPVSDINLLQTAPERKTDTLNNVEQITVDHPTQGEYVLTIKGSILPTEHQQFAVAYQIDSANHFMWSYPTASDAMESGRQQIIRWESNIDADAVLEYSIDNGPWQIAGDNVLTNTNFFRWVVPDTSALARLRITVPSLNLVKESDEFVISNPVYLKVGFDCIDSTMVYWNDASNKQYQIYRLGEKYLEPVSETTDTFFVFRKNASSALHYAVGPKIRMKEGFRSYTINYTLQGTGCYFQTFYALNESVNAAKLELGLGSIYGIKKISFEKLQQSGFQSIFMSTMPSHTKTVYVDNELSKGINSYRAAITLSTGNVIYSSVETIFHFPDDPVIIFPNPVRQNQTFKIIAQEPGVYSVIVYDVTGKPIYKGSLQDINQQMQGFRFSKGIYFFRIYSGDRKSFVKKLLVL